MPHIPYLIAGGGLALVLGWFLYQALEKARRALRRQARAEQERDEVVNFLNRFAASILSSEDAAEWMGKVAGHLAHTVDASCVRILMIEEDGALHLSAQYGEMPPLPEGEDYQLTPGNRLLAHLRGDRIEVGDGVVGEAILGNASQLIEDVGGPRYTGDHVSLRTALVVPLTIDAQCIGGIVAANKHSGGQFNADDQFLLESLAAQVALGGTLVQAHEALREKSRLEQELHLAQAIQKSLLPTRFPTSRSFNIHGVNVPAREVSGDFYDIVAIDERFLLVAIADASGKGMPACLLMASCRSFLRANAARFKEDLEGLFQEMNRIVRNDTDGAQFVTMACCLLDKREQTIEYARAGHTELLLRRPEGDVQVISPDGPALGLLPEDIEVNFDTFSFSWQPGSAILLFTDGITEALNSRDEEFGLDQLLRVWSTGDLAPEAACQDILARVEAFVEGTPQADDQTVVALSRPRDGAPPGATAEAA